MAHPYSAHREHHVEKERVGHIAPGHKHRAHGGRVHEDEGHKHSKKMSGEKEHGAEGKKSKHRRDRVARAHGGKVGKKGGKGATHVNVIVGQHPSAPTPPMMPPPPPAAAAPPPMPPGAGGMPGLGGPPPGGMPMRAKGGSVKSGPAWKEGLKNGTQVQHSPALSVTENNMNRGKAITYAKGGKVEAPQGVEKVSKLSGGAGGGEGRLEKAKRYGGKPMKEVNGAR